ncbi:MAG: YbaB/EbfC family nucleoid-associated protein [Acidimicrobiia bacterium]
MAKPPRGGMPDMQKLLQQAQQMQADMAKAQEELEGKTFEATAGGGVVTAVVTGAGKLAEFSLDPSILDPEDPEMVGDLVVAAVNQALEQAQEATASAMDGAAGLDVGSLGLGDLLG